MFQKYGKLGKLQLSFLGHLAFYRNRNMKNFFSFSTRDPEYLETVMAPILGRASVRPVETARFNATVRVKQLDSLSVFTLRADSIKINIEPPHHYVGLHLPLGWPFIVTENTRKARFEHDIHFLKPDRPLALEAKRGCRVLVAHLYAKPLQDYAFKLNDSDKLLNPNICNRIEIFNPAGLLLARSLANLWTVSRRFEYDPNSYIEVMEIEAVLIAQITMATETMGKTNRHIGRRESTMALTRAEEYLNANLIRPVSRADLAAAAKVSIRTLSREFNKQHGTGPMGYLKARRLDAAYRELLGTEANSTSVTEVALRFGFNHLGKFAIEYKLAFGESPSVTLNR